MNFILFIKLYLYKHLLFLSSQKKYIYISYCQIKDMGFKTHLHKKLIGILT